MGWKALGWWTGHEAFGERAKASKTAFDSTMGKADKSSAGTVSRAAQPSWKGLVAAEHVWLTVPLLRDLVSGAVLPFYQRWWL